MKYQVVTVSDRVPQEWYYLYRQHFQSLKDFVPLVLSPEMMGQRFNGLGTKPRWLYRAIKEKKIESDYIIFNDSWDLIWCTTPAEVMSRYFGFGKPIAVSTEKNCFPDEMQSEYDKLDCPTEYKYLNSGFIVGETEAILAILEAMDLPNQPEDHRRPDGTNFHLNDQALWLEQGIKNQDLIGLDYKQELSQTLHQTTIDEFSFTVPGRIVNISTNSMPCTIHFNGSSKDNLSLRTPILQHLGL